MLGNSSAATSTCKQLSTEFSSQGDRYAGNNPPKQQANRSKAATESLTPDELRQMDAYWRACNYLCVGMIYLRDNPLLREPLKPEHIKNRLLGHWGSDPGQSFTGSTSTASSRSIDLDVIYISGPGHGAPATLANCYLEGVYSEVYPDKQPRRSRHAEVLQAVLLPRRNRQPLHARDSRLHPRGRRARLLALARLRRGLRQPRPHRRLSCVGDGEAETGPLATSWHSNKFLNPIRDGAVLPVLHLNGYKIANPTILARIPHEELEALFRGYGWTPYFVEGDDPEMMHQQMAATLEHCVNEIRAIQQNARARNERRRRARAGP